jgi:hypothetical protein
MYYVGYTSTDDLLMPGIAWSPDCQNWPTTILAHDVSNEMQQGGDGKKCSALCSCGVKIQNDWFRMTVMLAILVIFITFQ